MRHTPSTCRTALLLGALLALPVTAQSAGASEPLPPQAGGAAGIHGSQGLVEVGSAFLGAPGILRLGVLGEHAQAGNFPDPGGDHVRTAGTFALSFVPLSWLELSASYAAAANTNTGMSPALLQALGDVTVGVKVAGALTPWLSGGVELTGLSFPGIGDQTTGSHVFGIAPRGLLSLDVQRLTGTLPLRAHLNLGARIDGTGDLAAHELTAAETLGLAVNRYPRLTWGLGVEAPLPFVTPFAEHAIAAPLGLASLVEEGGALPGAVASMRHTLTVGARVTAIRDLALTLAGQFALNRTITPGLSPTLPFNLFFGASFNLDTQRGPRAALPTSEAPARVQLEGVILDQATRLPLDGAIVTVVGSEMPPVASEAGTGRFLTHALQGEQVTVSVQKDGYLPFEAEVSFVSESHPVQLLLEARPRVAHLEIAVAAGGRSVPAELAISGHATRTVTIPAGATAHRVELAAGLYTLSLRAEGHLAQTRDVQVSEGGSLPIRFELEPAPQKPLVILKDDKLEILQQVRFNAGGAELHPDSRVLLEQVVDAVIRHDLKRLRVEGHTDSSGRDAVNRRLSRERAQAVAEALVGLGLDRARLDVEGYGSSRPLAPNVTARGRQLNRRVDFMIVER